MSSSCLLNCRLSTTHTHSPLSLYRLCLLPNFFLFAFFIHTFYSIPSATLFKTNTHYHHSLIVVVLQQQQQFSLALLVAIQRTIRAHRSIVQFEMGLQSHLFRPTASASLHCPLCRQVLDLPIQSAACGHVFCESCVITRSNTLLPPDVIIRHCPLDLTPITSLRPLHDDDLLDKLDQLTLCCPHSNCTEIGSYLQIRLHRYRCIHRPNVDSPETSINECAELQQIYRRNVAELQDLQFTIERIQKQFDRQANQAEQVIQTRLLHCEHKSRKINQRLLTLQNQLTHLVHPDGDLSLPDSIIDPTIAKSDHHQIGSIDEPQICVAYARNLNQFLEAAVLREFLRQNGVRVLSCEVQTTAFERSRDFRIEFLHQDIARLLDSSLWPVGVCVHLIHHHNVANIARSPSKQPMTSSADPSLSASSLPTIIHGQRSDPAVLLINSGFIY